MSPDQRCVSSPRPQGLKIAKPLSMNRLSYHQMIILGFVFMSPFSATKSFAQLAQFNINSETLYKMTKESCLALPAAAFNVENPDSLYALELPGYQLANFFKTIEKDPILAQESDFGLLSNDPAFQLALKQCYPHQTSAPLFYAFLFERKFRDRILKGHIQTVGELSLWVLMPKLLLTRMAMLPGYIGALKKTGQLGLLTALILRRDSDSHSALNPDQPLTSAVAQSDLNELINTMKVNTLRDLQHINDTISSLQVVLKYDTSLSEDDQQALQRQIQFWEQQKKELTHRPSSDPSQER